MRSCGIDDDSQIRKLLARYAVAMDAADAEGVAALFAADGSMEILGSVIAGRAAIAATVRAYDEAGALQGGKHLTLNSLIDVTGDRATARSDWLVVRVEGDAWTVFAAGHYDDELERVDGHWCFRRRVDVIEGPVPGVANAGVE